MIKLNNLKKVLRNIDRGVEQGVRQTLDEMETRAKELTPTDTGELIGSYSTTYDAGSKSGVLNNDAEHAGYVEYGTSRAQFYHKGPPTDASTVYRTSGDYKGQRGARMMTQTADEFRPKFRRQIISKIKNEILST